jgi:hypothetical protein
MPLDMRRLGRPAVSGFGVIVLCDGSKARLCIYTSGLAPLINTIECVHSDRRSQARAGLFTAADWPLTRV